MNFNMRCSNENCKICNKEQSLWEYIFQISFKESMKRVEWGEVIATALLFFALVLILGWWGILAFLFFGLFIENAT